MANRELVIERSQVGDFFGEDGLYLESFGQLHTDIYGLSTATATWVSPADVMKYPDMYSPHPIWSFLHMERRTVSVEYGFVRTMGEYAGFEALPIPVVEYTTAVNEEPITTHHNFETFAGTPASPQNGAEFRDPVTNKISNDNNVGVFERFWSNPPNAFSGVTSYLAPVLVKRITTITPFPDGFTSQVGHLSGGMLCTMVSVTQRGIVFQSVVEYRGAGPRGWNTAIYS
jgi:hypothetical protein